MHRFDRTFNAVQHKRRHFRQTENAVLSYTINWAALLGSDTISTSTWTAEQSGVTISGQAISANVTTATLMADVGVYTVVNKIVTAAGLTDERIIELAVTDNNEFTSRSEDYPL